MHGYSHANGSYETLSGANSLSPDQNHLSMRRTEMLVRTFLPTVHAAFTRRRIARGVKRKFEIDKDALETTAREAEETALKVIRQEQVSGSCYPRISLNLESILGGG
jgi:hypothetical protein